MARRYFLIAFVTTYLLMSGVFLCHSARAAPSDTLFRDLSTWNVDKTPLIALGGSWSFAGAGFPDTVPVPGTWRQILGAQTPVGRQGHYLLRVKLPTQFVGERLMLDFRDIRPYFRARINGQLVAQSGNHVAEAYRVNSRAHSRIAFVPQQPELNIDIFMQNVGEFGNGLRRAPLLGRERDIEKRSRQNQTLIHLLMGCYLIFFFYHGFLYWQRREPELLYFIAICFIGMLYYSAYFAHLPELLWQELSFVTSIRLTRLGYYPFAYLGFAYFHALLGLPYYHRIRPWVLALVGVCVFSLVLPIYWVNVFSLIYQGLILPLILYCSWFAWKVWREGKANYRHFFYSIIFFVVCIFLDVLKEIQWIRGIFWLPWGSMGFLLGQAAFLSQRFHQDFLQVKALKNTLQFNNQNLEIQIAERTQHLHTQAQQLAQMSQFKEKMTRMVAHDLSVPLSTILYFTHQRVPTAEQTHLLHAAAQEAKRMVQSLSSLKALESDALVVQPQAVALHPLIEKVLQQVMHWKERKTIQIKLNVDTELMVMADPELLFRVLQNLVQNACEYSTDKLTLEVTAQVKAAKVEIAVVDNGPGIAPALWETLFKVKSESQRGLGLPFCKMAMEAQQGQLEIESSTMGTRSALLIPAYAYLRPALHLSQAEVAAVAGFLKDLNHQPFYMFTEIESLLQRVSFCLTNAHQPYIQAMQTALAQANKNDYDQLLKGLNHACSTG